MSKAATRLPRRFFEASEQERRVPVSVVWELTAACDLGCAHCGSRAGRRMAAELDTAECLQLIDEMAALGVRDVGLIGGEVYLRKDWLQIIRAVRAAGMDCSLQTGGRHMTAERAGAAVEAGVQSIGVSVDGLRETHDQLRGVRGSFDRAIELLSTLRALPIQASVNTQINRLSMP
ncbi:radical SAM protein [Sphingosinicellaceae bacterium]|nr:radical SAM protein [Sphingosinicellaceae bacterium]